MVTLIMVTPIKVTLINIIIKQLCALRLEVTLYYKQL